MKYYVYAYLREDGSPYYIGKGKDRRAYSSQRSVSKPPDDRITFLLDRLSEEESFEWEKFFIAAYGRKDNGTGVLRNLTDGGEGLSGHIASDELKKKRSENCKKNGVIPPAARKGSKKSDSWKEKNANNRAKNYIITTPNGETVEIRNLTKFCRENGLTRTRMQHVAWGNKNHHKGYKCKEI
jgi:hypothetical protein